MKKSDIHLVIMAGGSGTRFWPKSTSKKPKQLLTFGKGDEAATLLQQTLQRFDGLVPADARMIVTTKALERAVFEDAPETQVLAEPQGRNTAPCIYWAARVIAEKNPKAIMLVMPSDHYIPNRKSFIDTVAEACAWAAEHDDLVTLGIKPDRPETGYGYLKIGKKKPSGNASRVDAFVEKPNLEKAKEFLGSGNYLWNGGMFVWRAEVILRAFDELMPEMKKAWDSSEGRIDVAYPKMTATSIDYGVMEKAKNVVSFPLDCGWDDLGSWTSLEGIADVLGARHAAGVVSDGEAIAIESSGNIVDAPGKTVTLLGVNNLIVVQHGDAVLVADKSRAQDIKLIVEQLKKQKPELL